MCLRIVRETAYTPFLFAAICVLVYVHLQYNPSDFTPDCITFRFCLFYVFILCTTVHCLICIDLEQALSKQVINYLKN
jgi:hypothetical protein